MNLQELKAKIKIFEYIPKHIFDEIETAALNGDKSVCVSFQNNIQDCVEQLEDMGYTVECEYNWTESGSYGDIYRVSGW